MKRNFNQNDKSIDFIVIEDYTELETSEDEFPMKIRVYTKSKLTVPIWDIGSRKELVTKGGEIDKTKFIVNVTNIGVLVVKGSLEELNEQLEENRLEIKGFKNR